MPVSAVDALEIVFNALPADEQEMAYAHLTELHARRLAGEQSTAARMVSSLRRVAEHVGRKPTVDDYRAAQPGGQEEGEPLTWEDGRRAVFHTAIVMYEIDRTL